MIFVTGGAGFIGGNFVLDWLDQESRSSLINIDALTYAGNLSTLQTVQDHPRYQFVKVVLVIKQSTHYTAI